MRAMRGDSITRTRVGAGRGTGVVSERVSDACCMRGPYMLMRATHCIAACAVCSWHARGVSCGVLVGMLVYAVAHSHAHGAFVHSLPYPRGPWRFALVATMWGT